MRPCEVGFWHSSVNLNRVTVGWDEADAPAFESGVGQIVKATLGQEPHRSAIQA